MQTGQKPETNVGSAIQNWATAWSSHDSESLLALFTEDCVYEDVTLGAVNRGKNELRVFAETFFSFSPDLQLKVTSSGGSGGFAACEWLFSGTQQKEFMSKPASGKHWSIRGMSCFELRDGKIKRCSDYWDLTTFLKQLG